MTRSPEPPPWPPSPTRSPQRPAPASPGCAWDSHAHALLAALLTFRLQPHGFTNQDLRTLTAGLRGLDPHAVSPGQMTYDLRRLCLHSLIERVPHTHRYRVTDTGLHTAMFL